MLPPNNVRSTIEDVIERLLALLDLLDPDPDREPDDPAEDDDPGEEGDPREDDDVDEESDPGEDEVGI